MQRAPSGALFFAWRPKKGTPAWPGSRSFSGEIDQVLRSEVVGRTDTNRTRCAEVGTHAVGVGHRIGAIFIDRVRLHGTTLVQHIENIQAESQLVIGKRRAIHHAQIQAGRPGLPACVTRARRLATAIVIGSVVADRKSTRLNSSHSQISYAVFCLKKKIKIINRYL